MSEISSPQTFADLYTDLLNRAREDTRKDAVKNQAKRYINTALLDMHNGFAENFPWAQRSAVLLTNQTYSDGTIILTQGANTIGGVGTAFTTSNGHFANMRPGGKVVASGDASPYEVGSVLIGTGALFVNNWIPATTAGAGVSYTYYEDEYDLASDFLRPVDQQNFADNLPIELVGSQEFRRRWPRNAAFGWPGIATIIDREDITNANEDPVRRIRFNPVPNAFLRIPYSYITKYLVVGTDGVAQEDFIDDLDEPIVPRRYRHLIVLHALGTWYRDKKDDARSLEVRQEYVDGVSRAVGDFEIGAQKPQFRPRLETYVRRAKRPWRGGGHYDLNGRFDRMEDR